MKVQKEFKFDKALSKAKAVVRRALKTAAQPVKQVVQQQAQSVRRYGFLRASVAVKVVVYRDAANGVAVVGPKSKYTRKRKGKTYRPARYAHLVERKHRWISKAKMQASQEFIALFLSEMTAALTI